MVRKEAARKYFEELEIKIREEYGEDFEKYKKLCIIKNARFGMMDMGWISLSFTIHDGSAGAALHHAFYPEYEHYISMYDVEDIHQLNGKTVWAIVEGNRMRMFPFKPVKV